MKTFTLIAVIVFGVVAVLQLTRVILGWEVVIAGWVVPPWASLVACAAAAVLSVMVWRENRPTR